MASWLHLYPEACINCTRIRSCNTLQDGLRLIGRGVKEPEKKDEDVMSDATTLPLLGCTFSLFVTHMLWFQLRLNVTEAGLAEAELLKKQLAEATEKLRQFEISTPKLQRARPLNVMSSEEAKVPWPKQNNLSINRYINPFFLRHPFKAIAGIAERCAIATSWPSTEPATSLGWCGAHWMPNANAAGWWWVFEKRLHSAIDSATSHSRGWICQGIWEASGTCSPSWSGSQGTWEGWIYCSGTCSPSCCCNISGTWEVYCSGTCYPCCCNTSCNGSWEGWICWPGTCSPSCCCNINGTWEVYCSGTCYPCCCNTSCNGSWEGWIYCSGTCSPCNSSCKGTWEGWPSGTCHPSCCCNTSCKGTWGGGGKADRSCKQEPRWKNTRFWEPSESESWVCPAIWATWPKSGNGRATGADGTAKAARASRAKCIGCSAFACCSPWSHHKLDYTSQRGDALKKVAWGKPRSLQIPTHGGSLEQRLNWILVKLWKHFEKTFCCQWQGFVLFHLAISATKEKKELLKKWILSGQNAANIEADIVLSKTQSRTHTNQRELLTPQQMLDRKMPLDKVRAIVAKGGGIPDEDVPHLASCTRFWVSTGTTLQDVDEQKKVAEIRARADPSTASDVLFAQQGAGSSAMSADHMQSILQGLGNANPAADGSGAPGLSAQSVSFSFVFACTHWYISRFTRPVFRTSCKSQGEGQSQSEGKRKAGHRGDSERLGGNEGWYQHLGSYSSNL